MGCRCRGWGRMELGVGDTQHGHGEGQGEEETWTWGWPGLSGATGTLTTQHIHRGQGCDSDTAVQRDSPQRAGHPGAVATAATSRGP